MTAPQPLALPAGDWPGWLTRRVGDELGGAQRAVAALKDGSTRSTQQVLELWNDADVGLSNAAAVASLLSEVHPDADLRALAEERAREVERIRTDRGLDRELFEVVDVTEPTGLDAQAFRMRERVLRDFRRSGVDHDDATRSRLRDLSERLTVLEQDYSRAIRDDVRSIRITPDRLAGLPADFVEAHPVDADGLVTITTDYPDYLPFRTFAGDADARRELAVEFLNRAWPVNDAVLHEILDLREEKARLLGYASWPDYDTDVKMIGTGHAVSVFIERLADAADAPARRDKDVLVARQRADDPGATSFDAAQFGYYAELVRREQYAVDAQDVRRYFDFENVRRGLLEVTGRLFGVEYRPIDTPNWHPDVRGYEVVADGELRGRIYLDLHPRDGKYKHAAQFDLVSGVAGRQLPEGVLVCNFARGLMEHAHVVTLFHEFGHLLHHVLGGDQHWARFSGVATEWDFVEAPSQMLEEWAWDADILQTFAVDTAGAPIPRELVERMRAAKDFGKGLFVRNQLYYAAVSFVLHRDRPADITATLRELQARYDLIDYLDGTHFHASFGHLAGYTSGYYTYLWSLVIAKDLFSAFDPSDLFDPSVASRYRDRVLVPGGSRDAAELVADFLGRESTFAAFATWLDRAPVPVT